MRRALLGWRFQRRLKILPGVRINFSRGMPSVGIGGHGATINIGKKGVMGTASAPGTGISYRSKRVPWSSVTQPPPPVQPAVPQPSLWKKFMNWLGILT